jgi:hypothetical protein
VKHTSFLFTDDAGFRAMDALGLATTERWEAGRAFIVLGNGALRHPRDASELLTSH